MNLIANLIACGVLVLVVVGLFIYHHWLENHEDHYIHLHSDSHDSSIVTSQTVMHKRIASVEKIKNGLLIATILYALAIAGMAVYNAWNNAGT
jgi:tellurite resistance protein TehA-like permease